MSDELVTRIDLCVDLIHQPIADFVKLVETDCLLTRARRDEQVVKRDRGGGMQIRVYSANTNAQMIIYDKVRAARAKSDYAELDHWRWGDLHPEHVTRVEFRLTNKMMRAYNRTRALGVSGNLGAYLAVIRDARLRTGEQRWRRFAELTGRDRSAFYRTQREYRRVFPAPNLPRGRSARR